MLYKICYFFLLFFIYSILGWIVEVVNAYMKEKKFVNRGFLIGPYCPIYGHGVVLITILLKNYTDNFLVLFILSMAICMVLEYITSYLMEVLFKARWWDYSNKKFNINGRVCLETTIPFGLCGLLIMYVLNPIFTGWLNKIPEKVLIVIAVILMILMLCDYVLSFLVILKVKNVKLGKIRDNTEEINRRVHEYLAKHSRWTKRLDDSFPNLRGKKERFRFKKKKDK